MNVATILFLIILPYLFGCVVAYVSLKNLWLYNNKFPAWTIKRRYSALKLSFGSYLTVIVVFGFFLAEYYDINKDKPAKW